MESSELVEKALNIGAGSEELITGVKPVVTLNKVVNTILHKALENTMNPVQQNTQVSPLTLKIAQSMEDKMIEQFINNFGGQSNKQHSVWGTIEKAAEAIKAVAENPQHPLFSNIGELSKNILGAVRNDENGNNTNGKQQTKQSSPEEIILQLNPDNLNDLEKWVQLLKSNPQNPQVDDINQLRQFLIEEQIGIRQRYGLPLPDEQITNKTQNQPRQSKDINRQLINRYEQGGSLPQNEPFFNDSQPIQQNISEKILSLSPDDPVSLHEYQALKGIKGVDQSIVKKMMTKEQEELRAKMGTSGTKQGPVRKQETFPSGDRWTVHDLNKPLSETKAKIQSMSEIMEAPEGNDGTIVKKSDFHKEINYNPKEDSHQGHQNEQNEPPIQSVDPVDKIMRVLDKLDRKIEWIENEVVALKAGKVIDLDYGQLINPNPVMEDVNVNLDNMGVKDTETLPENNAPKSEGTSTTEAKPTIEDNQISNIVVTEIENKETPIAVTSSSDSDSGTSSSPSLSDISESVNPMKEKKPEPEKVKKRIIKKKPKSDTEESKNQEVNEELNVET